MGSSLCLPDLLGCAGLVLGERLGSGAMGAVYAVSWQGGPSGALALKVLHAEHAGDLGLVLRFFNEERAAARVCHPGVVRVHSSGLADGRPYLILERLRDTLTQRAALLSPALRIAVVTQVAIAAAALHRAGVVHRDLKPDNIMFGQEQPLRARIVDLGLAKLSAAPLGLPVSTDDTDVLGTAQYRAPELWISARNADGRADVYALGVVLYELLTGRLPFQADRESVLMDLHLFAPPPQANALPAAIGALLGRMLAKDRAQRPEMNEVALALSATQG